MQVLNGQYFLDSPISVLKWIISICIIQWNVFSTLYNGLCNHIKEDIYETDKWAGSVHLQGGICDEKQRGINIKKWGESEEILIVPQALGDNPPVLTNTTLHI